MKDADTPLGYKAVKTNGMTARHFTSKEEAVAFQKHPSSLKRYPGLKIHAVIGDETGVHEEVIS